MMDLVEQKLEQSLEHRFHPDPTLKLPILDSNTSKPIRTDLKNGFYIDNFLSSQECEFYCQQTEKIGYKSIEQDYPTTYRSCERVCLLSRDFSDLIWKRLNPHLTKLDVDKKKPMDFSSQGVWKPQGINECIKFSKYHVGHHFKPHLDGLFTPTPMVATVMTILIYLNDDFEGGKTNFVKMPQGGILKFLENTNYEITESYTPKRGSALVFSGDVLHEGEIITKGVKYIIRTEILFEKITMDVPEVKKEDIEKQLLVEMYYNETARQMKENATPMEITQSYLNALHLQYEFSEKQKNEVTFDVIPDELICQIASYLGIYTVSQLQLVNRHWYHLIRGSNYWEDVLSRTHSDIWKYQKSINQNCDWYRVCKNFTLVRIKRPLILYFGEYLMFQDSQKWNEDVVSKLACLYYVRPEGWYRRSRAHVIGEQALKFIGKDGFYNLFDERGYLSFDAFKTLVTILFGFHDIIEVTARKSPILIPYPPNYYCQLEDGAPANDAFKLVRSTFSQYASNRSYQFIFTNYGNYSGGRQDLWVPESLTIISSVNKRSGFVLRIGKYCKYLSAVRELNDELLDIWPNDITLGDVVELILPILIDEDPEQVGSDKKSIVFSGQKSDYEILKVDLKDFDLIYTSETDIVLGAKCFLASPEYSRLSYEAEKAFKENTEK
jgi:hypothetical protein